MITELDDRDFIMSRKLLDGPLLAETTNYCDEKCDGFEFGGVTYMPKEGDVVVTMKGTARTTM